MANLVKEKRKISTCDGWAHLETIGIFPDYRAQESPRTLICGDPCHVSVSIKGMIVGATSTLPCLAHPSLANHPPTRMPKLSAHTPASELATWIDGFAIRHSLSSTHRLAWVGGAVTLD